MNTMSTKTKQEKTKKLSLHDEVHNLNISHKDQRASYGLVCQEVLLLKETVNELTEMVQKQQLQINYLSQLLTNQSAKSICSDQSEVESHHTASYTPIDNSEYKYDEEIYKSNISLNSYQEIEDGNSTRNLHPSSESGDTFLINSISVSYSPGKSRLIGHPLPDDIPSGPVLCLNEYSSCLFNLDNRYKRIQMTRWSEIVNGKSTGGLIGKLILLPEIFNEVIVRPVFIAHNKNNLQIRLKTSRSSFNKRISYPIHLIMLVRIDFLNGYQHVKRHKFVLNNASSTNNSQTNQFFFPLKGADINRMPNIQLQFLPV